jgi:hypothetical protein
MQDTVTSDPELELFCCEQPALDSHDDNNNNNNKKGEKSNHGPACFRTYNLRLPSPDTQVVLRRIISIIEILQKLVHSNKT